MRCPKCGSEEICIHVKNPLEEKQLICIDCGHVFPGKPDETVPRHIRIKSWRPAWWEAQKSEV